MKLQMVRAIAALAMSGQLGVAMAAAPVIGTIAAGGSFRVDRLNVNGNATVFEGSLVETASVASTLSLSSGARLSLEAGSRGKLFGDRLVLEKGETRLENGTGFHLEALGLRVQPERGASTGRVALDGTRRVRVAALTGSFRILNAQGQLVANLPAGATLAFEPQQGASTATRVTGVVEYRSGRYVLTDEMTNVTFEVLGLNLSDETGKRVEITGVLDAAATPSAGASQVIRVTEVRRLAGGAAAAGQGGTSIAKVSVATITIVGGVAVAAVVGGLAAADALPGQGDGVSR